MLRSVGLPSSWPSPSDREVFACNRAGRGKKGGGGGTGGRGPVVSQDPVVSAAAAAAAAAAVRIRGKKKLREGRGAFYSGPTATTPPPRSSPFFAPLFIPLRTEGRRRGQPSPGPQRSSVFLQLLPRDTVSPFFPLPANGSLCTRAQVRKLYRESSARSDAIKC